MQWLRLMRRRTPNLEKIAPRRLRDPLTRSQLMGRIRSKNTMPEVRTRLAVHALGVRFRIHVADLPGKPDLANKTRHWAIFVHGCFWHSHEGCQLASKPRSNTGYGPRSLSGTGSGTRFISRPCATLAMKFSPSGNARHAMRGGFLML